MDLKFLKLDDGKHLQGYGRPYFSLLTRQDYLYSYIGMNTRINKTVANDMITYLQAFVDGELEGQTPTPPPKKEDLDFTHLELVGNELAYGSGNTMFSVEDTGDLKVCKLNGSTIHPSNHTVRDMITYLQAYLKGTFEPEEKEEFVSVPLSRLQELEAEIKELKGKAE